MNAHLRQTTGGNDRRGLQGRAAWLLGTLVVANLCSWLWAIFVFRDNAALLTIALIVYSLGLRHGLDADHIVAIDNITRKFVEENETSLSVGLFFAMGHSALIMLGTLAIACSAALTGIFERINGMGETIGTGVSAFFLLAVAIMNGSTLVATLNRSHSSTRDGLHQVQIGSLARYLRPLFRLVSRSWHMLPLGFLFGFGFDTASEIAIFGISAGETARGASLVTIAVFGSLFCTGMIIVDTADGVLMKYAYEWAFIEPSRKLRYNLFITSISVIAAALIGGIELFGLVGQSFDFTGAFWSSLATISDNFNILGVVIICLFLLVWALFAVADRYNAMAGLIDQLDRSSSQAPS